MSQNKKLAALLRGKTVEGIRTESTVTRVHFSDGLDMAIDGSLSEPRVAPISGAVQNVLEEGPVMLLHLDSGVSLQFQLNDPGGSVLVRDATQTVKYAG